MTWYKLVINTFTESDAFLSGAKPKCHSFICRESVLKLDKCGNIWAMARYGKLILQKLEPSSIRKPAPHYVVLQLFGNCATFS